MSPRKCCIALGWGMACAATAPLIAADCNTNGVEDAAEIAAGTSRDCNGNGVPDSCDLAMFECSLNAGNALHFDGVNDVAKALDHDPAPLGGHVTVEFWINLDNLGNPNPPWLVTKLGGGGSPISVGLDVSGAVVCAFAFGPSGPSVGVGAGLIPLQQWTHIAMTIDTQSRVTRAYRNGRLVADQTWSGSPNIGASLCENDAPFLIGALPLFPPGNWLDGMLDEIRIWNVARTPEEILANFNKTVPPDSPGLIAYWSFDETIGEQQILDSSPKGNNGFLGGSAVAGGDDPLRVISSAPIRAFDECQTIIPASTDCNSNGVPDECDLPQRVCESVAGNALHFDRTNDFATISDSPSLRLSSAATIEAWIRPTLPYSTGQRFINKGDGAVCDSNRAYEVALQPASAPNWGEGIECHFFTGDCNGSSTLNSSFPVSSAGWIHVAVTHGQANGQTQIFANGTLISAGIHTPAQPIFPSDFPLILGSWNGVGQFYGGDLDELRIWNVVRSPEDIAADMNRSIDSGSPGLVGYWNFDEALEDQNILDQSLFDNHGVRGGNAAVESTDPVRIASTAPIFSATNCADVGTSFDCNSNQVPDECDLAAGTSSDDDGNGVPDDCAHGPFGDMNCDGRIDGRDIFGFALAMIDPALYEAHFPECDVSRGDADGDGDVDYDDHIRFVIVLMLN